MKARKQVEAQCFKELSMAIVELAIKDYIFGIKKCLHLFGYIPNDPYEVEEYRNAEKLEYDIWIKNYRTAKQFIGSDWFYELAPEVDATKIKRWCIDKAYMDYEKKKISFRDYID